jgi:hypothetical protein
MVGAGDIHTHCLFCRARLPGNDVVEHFPVGRRIAFDPGRGRLWAVCPSCRRWNLAPLETRWEALEELERARVDRGRVMASTENIALIDVHGVQLVRVGETRLAEEAWWRYGTRMQHRRTRYRATKLVETGALVAAWAAVGGFFYAFGAGDPLSNLIRLRRFGLYAWQGFESCVTCGTELTDLTWRQARRLHITHDKQGDPALHLQCSRCRRGGRVGEFQLEGVVAEHVLRRFMTYSHFNGASEGQVRSATDFIDRLGSPAAVTAELSRSGLRLDALVDGDRRTRAMALEIALNEESERRLLDMEMAELEARWRAEEEIAGIVDGVLTPSPSLDGLRRRSRNGDGADK